MQVLFEMMVQIKQKMGIGVENPSPRSFSRRTRSLSRARAREAFRAKLFVRVKGLHASVCVHAYMQYDTHTNWQTGEEGTDRGGGKSAAARTYDDDNDVFFDFSSTPWGSVYTRGGVI